MALYVLAMGYKNLATFFCKPMLLWNENYCYGCLPKFCCGRKRSPRHEIDSIKFNAIVPKGISQAEAIFKNREVK